MINEWIIRSGARGKRRRGAIWLCLALPLLTLLCVAHCPADTAPASMSKTLLDMGPGVAGRVIPSSVQVTVAASQDPVKPGLNVTIAPGAEAYPGIGITPPSGRWDLSAYGHVEARVVNTGSAPLTLSLRVDNAGNWQDNPWDTESVTLAPGQAGTIKTVFGYSYGLKPGYRLNPSAVVHLLLFAPKSDSTQSFRVESFLAEGPAGETPPVAPEDIRVVPPHGVIVGAGAASVKPQLAVTNGAQVSVSTGHGAWSVNAVFPTATSDQSVSLRPSEGRWDLRNFLEVHIRLRNTGPSPITPRARLESNGGPTDWVTVAHAIAPGAEDTLAVPFAPSTPVDITTKDTGGRITSDAISGISLAVDGGAAQRALQIESIRAVLPPADLPEWLGQRPPVLGDWVKTLDDEFDGTKLNTRLWSIYGPNYWDKASHWSKDDVLVADGAVTLRYEKKYGPNNDDPTQKSTPYAAGYLHTYDKWAQRYGYFEARMKVPTAPGLWPAFWMMPDRGPSTKPAGERQDTANGGMEFDIMEHLDRWGPCRYNIAMHYDGYGKDHKSVGSDRIYCDPDKDGYITCGLLWTPGSAVFYCNGKEVLRWKNPRISDVPEMLMFTLPQGGWDNNPIDDARLPDGFVVDYVRVWQRRDLAESGDGYEHPAP